MTAAIRSVRAEAFRVPLAQPVRFATRAVDAREYVVTWVETEDGLVGTGHTYAGTRGGRLVRDRDEAVRYFVERTALGERVSLEWIKVSPVLADGNVDFELAINRDLSGRPLRHRGKGAVYCGPADAWGILVLSFGPA